MFPKPEPDVVKILREYRAALGVQDSALMEEMANRWLQVMNSLDADIKLLAVEMMERRAKGDVITQQMLWLDKRYQALKSQMETALGRYTNDAANLIAKGQSTSAAMGIEAAQSAIIAQTDLVFNQINISAVESMIGFLRNGAPLETLLQQSYPLAMDGLGTALVNGIARGFGSTKIAMDMVDGSGMGLERAVLIGRTEVARAFRTSSTKQYRESGVVHGFRRLVFKPTACLACLMLDGEHFDAESELDDHPAGKCVAVPEIIGETGPSWETGEDWFAGLSPEQQQERMGGAVYEAWKDGQFSLADLAQKNHSETWGDSPRVATLSELTK